ncbi:MAG: RNA polymerase sigma factor [Myxococcota bacterium]
MTALRELQLVEAHRRGVASATAELLGAYQRRIYAVCYRMVRHPDDADDLTQDAMVKVLEGLDTYHGRSQLSTWIIRVTMNCCLSHLRKQKVRRHGSLEELSGSGESAGVGAVRGELSPLARVEQAERQALLLRLLRGLDPQMRAVLVLRDMQDLDYAQIGEVMEVPVGTVKSRLFRARAALRAAAEQKLDSTSDPQDS